MFYKHQIVLVGLADGTAAIDLAISSMNLFCPICVYWPIRVWDVPYAYGISRTRMGQYYVPYAYGRPI